MLVRYVISSSDKCDKYYTTVHIKYFWKFTLAADLHFYSLNYQQNNRNKYKL